MDLLNKKKIKELLYKVENLETEEKTQNVRINDLEDKTKIKSEWEITKVENEIWKRVLAIVDYLRIDFKEDWIDDPYCMKPLIPQIKIIKAIKKTGNKKKS